MRAGSLLVLVSLLTSTHAVASDWVLFSPATYGMAEALIDKSKGLEGNHCVRESVKVGDVIAGPADSKWTVKSLSGSSARCRSGFPIRARIEAYYTEAESRALQSICVAQGRKIGDRFNVRGVGEVIVRDISDSLTACSDMSKPISVSVLPIAVLTTAVPAAASSSAAIRPDGTPLPATSPPAAIPPTARSISERLRELKQLRDQDLITQEVYEEKQRDILKSQ